ncbi:ABC transporter substrate-binding protein [Paenibacillus luteus]|uniref:ABC transporter substrate-binding protein n=1 Tax=Paenibacillus luteus TaxID=2545753 RepID=UPI0011429D89|nr:ABC transporter substrate-binding protein [Paenibacillus luteus]
MKLKAFSLSLMIMMMLFAAACSNGGANNPGSVNSESASNKPADSTEKPVELRFAWWGSEERHTATLEAIKLFEAKNPNIKILPEYSGFDGYETKLLAQLAGNAAPDLFQSTVAINVHLGADNLLDLEGKLDVSGLDAMLLKSQSVGDKLNGIVIGLATSAYTYNKTLLDELGVKAPTPPYSWDDLATTFKEVAQKSGGKVYGAVDSSVAFDTFVEFGAGALGAESPFPNSKETYTFTEDQIKSYYQYWADLRKAGAAAPPDISATSDDSANSLVVTRRAAFVPIASSSFSRFQSQTKDELGMIIMPQNKDTGRSIKPGASQVISINASTKHADAAAKFIDFFINDTEAAKVLKTSRGVLPTQVQRDELLKDSALSDGDKKNIALIGEASQLEGLVTFPSPPGPQILGWKGMIEKVGQEIAFDKITVEEGAVKLKNDAYASVGSK